MGSGSLRAILASPVWAAQILTASKSFVANPLIGSPRLNQLGLHAWRVKIANRLAAMRRGRLEGMVSAQDRAAFERDGFVVKPDFLAAAEFENLKAQVRRYRGAVREMKQGDAVTRRIALNPAVLRQIPAVRAVLENPTWRGLLHYVGADSIETVNYIQAVLTRVDETGQDPQTNLHADTFHPTVKAWLFLDDVTEEGSPFTYVPGSHRLTPERLAWERRMSLTAARSQDQMTSEGSFRVGEAELAGLGLPSPRRLTAHANTLVVADTFGFHARGPSSAPGCRVEIWAFGRRNPFLPWVGLDLLRRAGLDALRAQAFWRLRDFLDARHVAPTKWKPRPNSGAYDPWRPPS